MNKQKKLEAIYKQIQPSHIGYQVYTDERNEVVMIGDVLDWEMDIGIFQRNTSIHDLLYIWKHTRLPIDDQPEETIDYVFNLLPKN